MTNVNKLHILLVLLLGAGAIAFFSTRKNDTEKIKLKIEEVVILVSVEKKESILKMASTASSIAALCTDPFRLECESSPFSGEFEGREVTQRFAQIRSMFSNLKIITKDINVQFREKGFAVALFRARITGSTQALGTIKSDYRVHCTMVKQDNDWHFSEVSFTPTQE